MSFHFRSNDTFCRIVEMTPALRRQIEATIEHLVALLDQYDGDPDMEDGADSEPYLGWTIHGGAFATDDFELDDILTND